MTTATKAPPTVAVTFAFTATRPRNYLGLPDLAVDCQWCNRVSDRVEEGCMCCLPSLRRLQPLLASYRWQRWRDVLIADMNDKEVVADWLEENDLPFAAHRLRLGRVMPCGICKGKGKIRNKWLTVHPHEGEPCYGFECVRGRVLRLPPLRTRERLSDYMTDEERAKCRDIQDRWLALPTVRSQVDNYGEDHSIAVVGSPTFRRVRTQVLPDWKTWFEAFFAEADQ